MSVQIEIAAGGESVVLERREDSGVYARLVDKINLSSFSEQRALGYELSSIGATFVYQ